jgi:SAM-dependent methyltransferase
MIWLDPDQIERIEALYDPEAQHSKFFIDPSGWVQNAKRRIEALSLKSGQKYWCLDLGCGVPYFGWVMEQIGYKVLNVDRPLPYYVAAADILEQEYISYEIIDELPPFPYKFDLITMYGVNIHKRDEERYRKLMKKIFDLVQTGGSLVVGMNYGMFNDVWKTRRWWRTMFEWQQLSINIFVEKDIERVRIDKR